MSTKFYFVDTDGVTDKVELPYNPVDVTRSPELEADIVSKKSLPYMDENGVFHSGEIRSANFGTNSHGATIEITGEDMTEATKNLIKAKKDEGLAQLYYDAFATTTYTVFIKNIISKNVRGTDNLDYFISLIVL